MRTVALYMPGEAEIDLLTLLKVEPDVSVCCVVDPSGVATGSLVAEAMGVPVHLSFRAAKLPAGITMIGPERSERSALNAAILDGTRISYLPTHEYQPAMAPVPADEEPLPTVEAAPAEETPEPTPPVESAPPVVAPEPPPAPPAEPDPPAAPTPAPGREVVRTLERIEDVLDRERLLPWLLGLAMDSVTADGGSLMLLDPRGDELFIAVARGLSTGVQHSTRVAVGQGIAGRVAATGISEIIIAHDNAGLGEERGALSAALCIPLSIDKDLLGVLNLSRSDAEPPFDAADLDYAEDIAHRASRILKRAEGVSHTREGELRHRLARHLMALAEESDGLEMALAGWSGSLTMDLGASGASLAVVREDGSLLVAESDTGGETRVGTVPQTHPAWNDVLDSGKPLIARQMAADGDDELSLFFLPVGRPRLQAILGLSFSKAADAHRFQGRSAAVVELLERRLPGLMRRFMRSEHLRRQQDLLTFMADHADERSRAGGSTELTALRVASARIVGARRTYLMHDGELLPESASPPDGWDAKDWAQRARDLMNSAGDGQWLSAGIDPGRNDSLDGNVLVVPVADHPRCGLILIGKERQSAGDSRVFTPFDADLALRLAMLLPGLAAPRPAAQAPAPRPAVPPIRESDLQAQLRREMDRADRYHVAFSLSAFRLPDDLAPDLAESAVAAVGRIVRSSDMLHVLEGGVVLVVAPEETNSVAHLEQRIIELISETLDLPSLRIRHGRVLYPGPFQTPEHLLGQALKTLDRD